MGTMGPWDIQLLAGLPTVLSHHLLRCLGRHVSMKVQAVHLDMPTDSERTVSP